MNNPYQHVYAEIVEQPSARSPRFRYECEGRGGGTICGVSTTALRKTFPRIQVFGFQGKAVVVVSCVTNEKPYKPHPHSLVGKHGCKRGVCTLEIPPNTMSAELVNVGIQCTKRKDVEQALKIREDIRVDPFKTGFDHKYSPGVIDLTTIRLCFQVFLDDGKGKFSIPLPPVVSDPISDRKARVDLTIVKMSDYEVTADGGEKDIILLCEKIAKDDIEIRFFEEKDGVTVWEDFGQFFPNQVHKLTAIWFKPPPYRIQNISENVMVEVQLRRPSDGQVSDTVDFYYHPLDEELRRKKSRSDDSPEISDQASYNTCPQVYNPVMEPDPSTVAYNYVENHVPNTQLYNNAMEPSLPLHMNPGQPTQNYNQVIESNPFRRGYNQIADLSPSFRCHRSPQIKNDNRILNPVPSTSSWNIPLNQGLGNFYSNANFAGNNLSTDTSHFKHFLDASSHVEPFNINSGDLGSFDILCEIDNLSETLNTNLSFSDTIARESKTQKTQQTDRQ